MSFYSSSRGDSKPVGRTTTAFGEGLPNLSDAKEKLSYTKPLFSERFTRNFSPSAKKSGEEILRDLKDQLRREGDMFFNNSPPDWGFNPKSSFFNKADDGEDFSRRSGMDDLRGRHPMFRMPTWMSEDDDMSDLAARMSHTPHFATMGRRAGPWRERRSSGGSAMSATSDDSCDAPTTDKSSQCSGGSSEVSSHEIPIRLEAPCPPSMEHNSQMQPQQQQQQQQQHQQQQQQLEENEPISPLSSRLNHVRKGAQYPVRTTSAVDATQPHEEFTRNTRCSSAPPEMADQPFPQAAQKPQPQRFVSKINITPQSPQSPNSPKATSAPFSPLPAKFNTVPKPFVPLNKQQQETQHTPSSFEQQPVAEQQQPQQNQYQNYQPQYQPQQQQHPQSQQFQPQQQQQYQPQQQYHQQQQSPRQSNQRPSVVRNIPIFVEGRDNSTTNEESHTPPKPATQWGQQWQQQQKQQPQPAQQQQKPQFRQQQTQQQPTPQTQPIPHPIPTPAPPQYQPQQQQSPQYQPQQHQSPQYQPQQQQSPQPEPKAKPQPAKDPRLTQIEAVQALVDEYKTKVDAFTGVTKNREFLYLDEMLTRALLQLDNVDPDGREDVRQARRAVIKNINAAIAALEAKASESTRAKKEKTPENTVDAMDTDTQEQQVGTKDTQEQGEKSSDNNKSTVTLPGDSSEQNSEAKLESMETAESQGGTTSATKENDTEATVSS